METPIIVMAITGFVFLVWCFSSVARDNDALKSIIRSQNKEIRELKLVNKEMLESNYKLTKKIKDNGTV